jgi:tetratricopeptide (TPR) repeat protein
MKACRIALTVVLLPALITFSMATASPATAQVGDLQAAADQIQLERNAFVAALRQFLEALAGLYGDEGSVVLSQIDSMSDALDRWDKAIETYKKGLSEVGVRAEVHLALGSVYLDRGKGEEALREFAAAASLQPTASDVRILQGLAHGMASRPTAAVEAFEQAVARAPGNPTALYGLVQQSIRAADAERIAKTLRQFAETQWNARSEQADGRSSGAPFVRVGLLRQVAGVAPIFPPALYVEGFKLLTGGAYEKAVVQFKGAAVRDRLSVRAARPRATSAATVSALDQRFVEGSQALRQGRLKTTLELFARVVQNAPNDPEARRMLGLAYRADEQYDRSIEELTAAVRLESGDERSRLALADELVQLGRFAQAEQALKELVEAIPESGQGHYSLGRLYQSMLRHAEAIAAFDKAAAIGPAVGLDRLYETIGMLCVAEGDLDRAVDAYRKRLDANPNHAESHRILGETYLLQDRHDEALAEFGAALLVDARNADAYAGGAQVYLRTARFTEAEAASRRALALNPAHMAARYALGSSLARLGRIEEGAKEMEEFRRMQVEAAEAERRDWELKLIKQDARAAVERGDYVEAAALLQRAIAYEPDEVETLLSLGIVLKTAGRYEEAIQTLKKAQALKAGPEVYRHLAEGYRALGDLEESLRQQALYERAKEDRLRRAGGNR